MNRHEAPRVYVVDGLRTPFLKARAEPGPFAAHEMAAALTRALMERHGLAPDTPDELILGCVLPQPTEVNIARVAGLKAGLARTVPAHTVNRVCGSGMQALHAAALAIATGEADLVLAGGTEAMSHAPLMLNAQAATLARRWRGREGEMPEEERANLLSACQRPVNTMWCALSDSVIGMRMGETAERVAARFSITRAEMDTFALNSHRRAMKARADGRLAKEILAMRAPDGAQLTHDDGIRPDTSLEKLAQLRPAFAARGAITAGNSSQITDGAAMLMLASEDAVRRLSLPVLGSIARTAWAGNDPREMGLGPAHAIARLLARCGTRLEDIDAWEINEAFAAQVLGVSRALADDTYCREEIGLDAALGEIPQERLNIDGGAIALGHPIGASGARIVLHLLHVMRREGARTGVAALCIGGGQGGAMLLRAAESEASA